MIESKPRDLNFLHFHFVEINHVSNNDISDHLLE